MQDDAEKTEKPSPRKLRDAHDKGDVAKSSELTGWLIMCGFAIAVMVTGPDVGRALLSASAEMIRMSAVKPALSGDLAVTVGAILVPVGQSLLPALLSILLLAVIGNLAQTGGVFTAHPLKPDPQRMHPSNAIKRIFSLHSLFEFAKFILKTGMIALVAYFAFKSLDAFIWTIISGRPNELGQALLSTFQNVALYALLPLGALALLDLLFVRRQHMKKLRMSRRDLKDEHKQQEGDPEIRAKRKRLLRDLLKRSQSGGGIAGADVLLTNPTHFAVALRYRPREMRSPVVVAKGAGQSAAKLRAESNRLLIPSLRRPELTRRLFRECAIGDPVPTHLFGELAPIYKWLMARPGQVIST